MQGERVDGLGQLLLRRGQIHLVARVQVLHLQTERWCFLNNTNRKLRGQKKARGVAYAP